MSLFKRGSGSGSGVPPVERPGGHGGPGHHDSVVESIRDMLLGRETSKIDDVESDLERLKTQASGIQAQLVRMEAKLDAILAEVVEPDVPANPARRLHLRRLFHPVPKIG